LVYAQRSSSPAVHYDGSLSHRNLQTVNPSPPQDEVRISRSIPEVIRILFHKIERSTEVKDRSYENMQRVDVQG